jgi:hypothetical protein
MAREMSWYHFQLAMLKLQGKAAGERHLAALLMQPKAMN